MVKKNYTKLICSTKPLSILQGLGVVEGEGKKFSASRVSPKWVKSKRRREKERKKEERLDGNNNGQLRIANTTLGGACKAAWAK